jgi:curli production assembly/transport component CsgF
MHRGAARRRLQEAGRPPSDGAFRVFGFLALCVGGALHTAPAHSQDLTYEPINPSFGGNPFNSSHLLGIANAQNDYRDPRSTSNSSQADVFARQLQSRLLSALSSQIVDAIFGENPQESGTIRFGGQTIVFVRGIDAVTLTITNDETGEVTEIVIPTFINVN